MVKRLSSGERTRQSRCRPPRHRRSPRRRRSTSRHSVPGPAIPHAGERSGRVTAASSIRRKRAVLEMTATLYGRADRAAVAVRTSSPVAFGGAVHVPARENGNVPRGASTGRRRCPAEHCPVSRFERKSPRGHRSARPRTCWPGARSQCSDPCAGVRRVERLAVRGIGPAAGMCSLTVPLWVAGMPPGGGAETNRRVPAYPSAHLSEVRHRVTSCRQHGETESSAWVRPTAMADGGAGARGRRVGDGDGFRRHGSQSARGSPRRSRPVSRADVRPAWWHWPMIPATASEAGETAVPERRATLRFAFRRPALASVQAS